MNIYSLILASSFILKLSLATDNNSCPHDLALLEKVFKMDREMKDLKEDMRRLQETVISVMDHRWKEMKTFMDEITGAKDKVMNNSVVFSANQPTGLSLTKGQDIVFSKIRLNEGNGYDASTGVFTAPIDGVYQFNVQACNKPGEDVAYAIMHEENQVELGLQYQPVGSSCSSAGALIIMKKAERVWIRCTYPGDIYEDVWRRAAFMGVLLQ